MKISFYEQWLACMCGRMEMGGIIRNNRQEVQLENQFHALSKPQFYRNLDMSFRGRIFDAQLWINDYTNQMSVQSFEPHMAQELSNHINTQPK